MLIVAVKVVSSSASIIVHYTHVHVASQNTSEISLGDEYKILSIGSIYMKSVQSDFITMGVNYVQVCIICEELL